MGPIGTILLHETAGTAMLLLLGVGVVANAILAKTKGNGGGWLMISFGWGLAVFAGVYVAYKSGAHLNPAVTFGILSSGATEYAPGIPITVGTTFAYLFAQLLGATIGRSSRGWSTRSTTTPKANRATSSARSPPGPRSAATAGTSSPR